MERYIKARDYKILIYDKEDRESYRAAINALTEAKKMSGWDRVQGVTIHKDCRIPDLYHGDDLAIIMERDNGNGSYRQQAPLIQWENTAAGYSGGAGSIPAGRFR